MPYTPPSPSPNASRTTSRSSSVSLASPPSSTTFQDLSGGQALTPRSASYLHKHRRSQAPKSVNISNDECAIITSPVRSSSTGPPLHPPRSSSSLHQSPSPVSNASMIPTGAIISPPDSSQNSSDDESSDKTDNSKRGRQLVNLAELEEAIRNIPQRKQPSPDRSTPRTEVPLPEPKSPEMLSAAIHNKISHSRSSSDSYMRDFGKQLQRTEDDDDSDIDDDPNFVAPPMVRKKSGELVKSSLKTPFFRRRPSSMPSTPTYPKAVHFDQHLEHVRHFLQAEKPLAVSAGSSPVESAIEYDAEYPFPVQDYSEPPFEWEIGLPNFPELADRSGHVVRVEKVVLSHDNKSLLGTVAVANIYFQKLVVARFTLDYWQTTSEVVAEYNNDVRRKQREDGFDRFTFKIRLEDRNNLENKTLFFCVRYRVGDQEHWDNNNSINYQVDFKKKAVPQLGKNSSARFALPRSRPSVSMAPRPKSIPSFDSFDAFENRPDVPIILKPKVKIPAPASDVDETEAPARRANPSGNAFGNRYDFESSLAAAITTAAKVLGPERSGLSFNSPTKPVPTNKKVNPYFRIAQAGGDLSKAALPRSHSSPAITPMPKQVTMAVPRLEIKSPSPEPRSSPLPKTLNGGDKPSIESSSYRELLDNYCFFGSAKASPQVALNPASMPEKPTATHVEGGLPNGASLSVYNYSMPSSRSPSPRPNAAQAPALSSSPRSSSRSSSSRSSRSSSPIYSFQAMHSGTVGFDSSLTPTAIHT